MQIITNLKRKSIKETQVNLKVICPRCASFETHVKLVKPVAMPTLLHKSEQTSSCLHRATMTNKTLYCPTGAQIYNS